jgi:predicted Co/Zn/Cd cation transporter (cation efflux family)
MRYLKNLAWGHIFSRFVAMGVLWIGIQLVLAEEAKKQQEGAGANIGLVLILGLVFVVIMTTWGAIDGFQWANQGKSKLRGRRPWGAAIIFACLLFPLAEKIAILVSDASSRNFSDFIAAAVEDLLVSSPLLALMLCSCVIVAFSLSYERASRSHGIPR